MGEIQSFHIERKLKIIKDLLSELNNSSENEKWKIKFLKIKLNKINGLFQEIPLVQLKKKTIKDKDFKTVHCVDTLDQVISYLEFLLDYKKDY